MSVSFEVFQHGECVVFLPLCVISGATESIRRASSPLAARKGPKCRVGEEGGMSFH
jgi:hypothetical protein